MLHDVFRATQALSLKKEAGIPLPQAAALLVGGVVLGAGLSNYAHGSANRDAIYGNVRQSQFNKAMSDWNARMSEDRKQYLATTPGADYLKAAGLVPPAENVGKVGPAFKTPAPAAPLTADISKSKGSDVFKSPDKQENAFKSLDTGVSTKVSSYDRGTLLAAGMGGVGGYMVGQSMEKGIREVAKAAPIGGAIGGALLLAALVTLMRNRESAPSPPPYRPRPPYGPDTEGYMPNDRVPLWGRR